MKGNERPIDIPLYSNLLIRGRMAWQATTGYNRRSRIETQIGCWKSIIGPKLKARRFSRQITEIPLVRNKGRIPSPGPMCATTLLVARFSFCVGFVWRAWGNGQG